MTQQRVAAALARALAREAALKAQVALLSGLLAGKAVIPSSIAAELSPGEAKVLQSLVSRRRASRAEILATLGGQEGTDARIVDVYVSRIRGKLGPRGVRVRAVRGYGYEISGESLVRLAELGNMAGTANVSVGDDAPKPSLSETCGICLREVRAACRSTRDMEERPDETCWAALMAIGGGEYTANRMEAGEWLRTMEMAMSAEPETWAQPITARPAEGSEAATRFAGLAAAGFAEPGENPGEWRLTARGILVVTGQRVPWKAQA